MPTYRIFASDGWYGVAVRCGDYERIEALMYSTKEAAQRRVLALMGY